KSFNLEKISLKDGLNHKHIKSFFYLQGKLYACIFDDGIIKIIECRKIPGQTGESSDVLPLITFELTDKKFSFNPNSKNYLSRDFLDKMKHNILRQTSKTLGRDLKLSNIDPQEVNFLDSVVCCSECVGRGIKGCFILVRGNVTNKVMDDDAKSKDEIVPMNIGLFFDGTDIVPCLEGASDNSFWNGTFSDYNVISMNCCGNKIAFSGEKSIGRDEKPGGKQGSLDFVCIGELFPNAENEVCFRLISSNTVEGGLKSFTFAKTKGGGSVLTTAYLDNQDNKIKFGELIKSGFSSQSANLVGIDFYKAKAEIPDRTRAENYHITFVGGSFVLLQYQNQDKDKSSDYLVTLNKIELPIISS
ncbi:MAG: hypothetical protein LBD32_00895, partial [Cytophagales bacterium]|nr:hypothetical protein [Cytophagales bacterium]